MKASILIRSHNAEKTIARAVNSAVNQNFLKNKFEVIIIDDGSSDKTLDILRKFSTLPNVTIIEQENYGGTVAVNNGLSVSQGNYITILDDDDEFEANLLKELCGVLEKRAEVDFVYSNYYEEYNGDIKLVSPRNIFETVAIGTLFRKNKLLEEGFHRSGIFFAEYDLFLRTINKWRNYYHPKSLFTYHRRSTGLAANPENVKKGIEQLEKLHPLKIDEIKKIRGYEIIK